MNFIVFDIEATCWNGYASSRIQETIEIGALRLNRYGEVEDIFNRFIKPVIYPQLSAYCQELTTISQVDVNKADIFPYVIEDFQDWGLVFDEDYVLCSWGSFDQKILMQDCNYYDMEIDWLESHIDLKKQYRELKRLSKPRGLKKAVLAEGFEFTGTQHRAIYDAENLAKVFATYLDEWRF